MDMKNLHIGKRAAAIALSCALALTMGAGPVFAETPAAGSQTDRQIAAGDQISDPANDSKGADSAKTDQKETAIQPTTPMPDSDKPSGPVDAPAGSWKVKEGQVYNIRPDQTYLPDFGPDAKTGQVVLRLKASKTGVLKVSVNSQTAARVRLLNDAGKQLSPNYNLNRSRQKKYIYFGVKKGVTYRLLADYTKLDGAAGWLKIHETKFTGASGSKKSKASKLARTVNRKKPVYRYGTADAGSKASRWYKLTAKKRVYHIYFTGWTSGKFDVTFYHYDQGRLTSYSQTITRKSSGSKDRRVWIAYSSTSKQTIWIRVKPAGKSSLRASGAWRIWWR